MTRLVISSRPMWTVIVPTYLGKQTLDIYRTFVPNALRGRGIAAALTEKALEYADEMGYTVIPSCSYVERYMERHQRHAAKLSQ